MTQHPDHSVTLLIQGLRGPKHVSDPAAAGIWQRYSSALLRLAHKRLSEKIRTREGAVDVVQDAYATFCKRFARGQYEVRDRDELLRLLVGITVKKVLVATRRNVAGKRSVYKEHQPASRAPGPGGREMHFEPEGVDATPEDAAMFDEQFERAMNLLDEQHRQIAAMSLSGLDPEQIAARLGLSVRTIQRKLKNIHQIWSENGIDDRYEDEG